MPLRMLLYISRVYERIIDNTTLYRRKRERIPKPEFIVVYNGRENCPDKETLRLSDAYKVEGSLTLELTVDVYNIAEGHNRELLERSKALADYSAFVSIVTRYESEGAKRADAIKKAIYNCVHDGIMKTYLKARGSEVMNMLITEFDVEEYYKVGRMEGVEEGMEKGMEKGRAEGVEVTRVENAKRMKNKGFDSATIVEITGLSTKEVEKL
jgi:predicted transposase/invertase (TIGR01784 family)